MIEVNLHATQRISEVGQWLSSNIVPRLREPP